MQRVQEVHIRQPKISHRSVHRLGKPNEPKRTLSSLLMVCLAQTTTKSNKKTKHLNFFLEVSIHSKSSSLSSFSFLFAKPKSSWFVLPNFTYFFRQQKKNPPTFLLLTKAEKVFTKLPKPKPTTLLLVFFDFPLFT